MHSPQTNLDSPLIHCPTAISWNLDQRTNLMQEVPVKQITVDFDVIGSRAEANGTNYNDGKYEAHGQSYL
jgi:hypothetical protein